MESSESLQKVRNETLAVARSRVYGELRGGIRAADRAEARLEAPTCHRMAWQIWDQ